MKQIKVSSKYQIVIPREIREKMDLRPGDSLQVYQYGERIELVPVRQPSDLKGFLTGDQQNSSESSGEETR